LVKKNNGYDKMATGQYSIHDTKIANSIDDDSPQGVILNTPITFTFGPTGMTGPFISGGSTGPTGPTGLDGGRSQATISTVIMSSTTSQSLPIGVNTKLSFPSSTIEYSVGDISTIVAGDFIAGTSGTYSATFAYKLSTTVPITNVIRQFILINHDFSLPYYPLDATGLTNGRVTGIFRLTSGDRLSSYLYSGNDSYTISYQWVSMTKISD
jgi:hypothetical protein